MSTILSYSCQYLCTVVCSLGTVLSAFPKPPLFPFFIDIIYGCPQTLNWKIFRITMNKFVLVRKTLNKISKFKSQFKNSKSGLKNSYGLYLLEKVFLLHNFFNINSNAKESSTLYSHFKAHHENQHQNGMMSVLI